MTPEAEKFLQKLAKQDPSKIYEWIEERGTIISVKLNQAKLTDKEIRQAIHHANNGGPTITIEWRIEDDPFHANGISAPFIFIDEAESPEFLSSFSKSDHITDALSYMKGPSGFHIKHLEKLEKKLEVSFTELELKHVEWSYLSKKQLYQILLRAESEEDFEECAQIRDYAASKGWELKK